MGRKRCFTNTKKQKHNKITAQYKSDPCRETKIISIPTNKIKLSFKLLQLSLCRTSLPRGWSYIHNTDSIVLCYLEQNTCNPSIIFTVTVAKDLQHTIFVYHQHEVSLQQKVLIHNSSDVLYLINYLTQFKICQANDDEKFHELADSHSFIDTQAYSFIDLIKYLFTIPGVKSFLSERISQDPLEKFFGQQRQRGATNENPTASQFLQNNQALRTVNGIKLDLVKGNTRGRNQEELAIDSITPLPKRRKVRGAKCSTSINPSGHELMPGTSPAATCNTAEKNLTCDVNTSQTKQSGYTTDEEPPSLKSVLTSSLQDEGFRICSPEAQLARKIALQMHHYVCNPANKSAVDIFENYFMGLFGVWLSVPPTSGKVREEIWLRFSHFTSSDDYVIVWNSLHKLIGTADQSPILAFYVTYNLFIRRWVNKYPIEKGTSVHVDVLPHLNYDEQNAIWYVAGYILRKVRKDLILKKANEDILGVIERLTEDAEVEEEDDAEKADESVEEPDSKAWLKSINRGGLVKCTKDFYDFLRAVENKVHCILSDKAGQRGLGNPEELLELVTSDNCVKESWKRALGRDQEQEIQKKIIKLYVTIRSFAFTKKTMEKYKQQKKEGLQKKRSLRTKLMAPEQ